MAGGYLVIRPELDDNGGPIYRAVVNGEDATADYMTASGYGAVWQIGDVIVTSGGIEGRFLPISGSELALFGRGLGYGAAIDFVLCLLVATGRVCGPLISAIRY